MFRSIWSKTLRDYRIPILGWGIGLGLLLLTVLATYATQITDASARASLGQVAQSLRFFGDAVAITTPQGYATFSYHGIIRTGHVVHLDTAGRCASRSR